MRIAVCNTQVPFTTGGGELHGRSLVDALVRRGHEAELVQMPFRWYPGTELVQHMLAGRMIDVTEALGTPIDRVIALRFPAYLVNHPAKVVWVLHQHRTAYELWGTEFGDLERFAGAERLRRIVMRADDRYLGEARRLFANSRTVAERLHKFNGLEATPLYHPPPRHEELHCAGYGDFLFAPSRLESIKRQQLLIEALARTRRPVRCLIAGSGSQFAALRSLVADRGLEDRVEVLGRIGRSRLVDLYARARAVYFGPYQEDYGYVTLEAQLSGKAVVTLEDSGGPLELVTPGVSGLVAPPKAGRIAEVLDLLWEDPALAEELGRQAREEYQSRGITWDRVVTALLDGGAEP